MLKPFVSKCLTATFWKVVQCFGSCWNPRSSSLRADLYRQSVIICHNIQENSTGIHLLCTIIIYVQPISTIYCAKKIHSMSSHSIILLDLMSSCSTLHSTTSLEDLLHNRQCPSRAATTVCDPVGCSSNPREHQQGLWRHDGSKPCHWDSCTSAR